MWTEMSQYIPNSAVSRETVATPDGKATQPGIPEVRSLWSARRCRICTRPLRWPRPRKRRAAVTIVAAVVAITIWPISAPPAGGAAAARRAAKSKFMWKSLGGLPEACSLINVTSNEVTFRM
jgi:hypothetical protein